MIGTAPLVVKQVGLINRTHMRATPLPSKWPRLRHDGDGVFTPHFPAEINMDGCAANDHLTYNKIPHWYVCAGEFEPYALHDGSLLRNVNSASMVCQDLTNSGLSTGYYRVALSGAATVIFGGTTTTYSWWGDQGAGNTGNTVQIEDGYANVAFGVSTPHTISVRMDNNNDQVDAITLTYMEVNPTEQVLKNYSFEDSDMYYYDIESWYEDSKDTTIVPSNTLGWLEGFNDSQIYSVFE